MLADCLQNRAQRLLLFREERDGLRTRVLKAFPDQNAEQNVDGTGYGSTPRLY